MDLGRVSPIAGIVCVVTFMTLWVLAAILDGDWVLGGNTLSDLGVDGNDASELCFNGGCALAGILAIIFALVYFEKKGAWRICGVTVVLAGLMLVGVGIVNLHYGKAHFFDASAHGVFAAISMLISVYGDWRDGHKHTMVYTILIMLSCVIVTLTTKFEVFEPFCVCGVMAWALGQSIKLLKEAKDAETGVEAPTEPGPSSP